jgi:hypothetical protein
LKPPYPISTYPISDIETVMRLMQTGSHIGKLVMTFEEGQIGKVRIRGLYYGKKPSTNTI